MIWGVAIAYNLFFLPDLLPMLCFPSCLYFSSTSALSDHLQSNYRPANYSGIKPATISDQNEKHHLERKIWILFLFFFFFPFIITVFTIMLLLLCLDFIWLPLSAELGAMGAHRLSQAIKCNTLCIMR